MILINWTVDFLPLMKIIISELSKIHATALANFDWGSFLGGVLGAIVIVITVYWTIKSTHNDTNIIIKESNRPVLIYEIIDSNYVYGIQQQQAKQSAQNFLNQPELLSSLSNEQKKLLELIAYPQPLLRIKNRGKGIALNITYCESINGGFAITTRNSLEPGSPDHLVEIKSEPHLSSNDDISFTNFMIQYQDIYGDYYIQMIGIQYNENIEANNRGAFAQLFGTLQSFRICFMTAPVITEPVDFSDVSKMKDALLLCDKQPTFYSDASDIYQQYIERRSHEENKS